MFSTGFYYWLAVISYFLSPVLAISSLILGFNLLADGLREISLRD